MHALDDFPAEGFFSSCASTFLDYENCGSCRQKASLFNGQGLPSSKSFLIGRLIRIRGYEALIMLTTTILSVSNEKALST
jgi:hypothetical protein